ncbi:MAG: hypothetical protein FWD14_08400 [Treponema sp.]|nr:hypothetical protein [Treponema sp.]
MKNKFKLIGIIALAAVIVFSIAACKEDDEPEVPAVDTGIVPANLRGTWVNDTDPTHKVIITSNTFKAELLSGSITVSVISVTNGAGETGYTNGRIFAVSPVTAITGNGLGYTIDDIYEPFPFSLNFNGGFTKAKLYGDIFTKE